MKSFPKDQIEYLREAVRRLCQEVPKVIAAFDADGTLWDTDLGEGLFDYQVRNRLVDLPPDPWKHYEDLKVHQGHNAAYLWLAQINAGLPISQVREWAKLAVAEMHPVPVHPPIKDTIAFLQDQGADVYIVTASIKWAVEPGAALVGLSPNQVIGIETKVKNGLVTAEQEGVITYREGKVTGLKARTGGLAPHFAAGNSEGDFFLIESASHQKLVVAGSDPNSKLAETERVMARRAREKGWLLLSHE